MSLAAKNDSLRKSLKYCYYSDVKSNLWNSHALEKYKVICIGTIERKVCKVLTNLPGQ